MKYLIKKFNELIQLRARIDKLSQQEKRQFNSLERDIERYSVDLDKIRSLIKQLENKEDKITRRWST